MDKVLVAIHAPSVNTRYDAFVPLDIPVAELIPVISQAFHDMTNGKYEISGVEILSLRSPDLLLNPKQTLREYNIRDGMQLYLI